MVSARGVAGRNSLVASQLRDLRSSYQLGDVIVVEGLSDETVSVRVRDARGRTYDASLERSAATIAGVPGGTHTLEVLDENQRVIDEELFGVREHPGEDPVLGFVTSFDDSSRGRVLAWLRDLRCTVVQVYDWMDSYSTALSASEKYEDPLGRPIERSALQKLIVGIKSVGAVAQAYAPVIAAGKDLATEHEEWCLFRNDGAPESLGDLLEIMDPGNPEWQRYWIQNYGGAADGLGFDGFHLDTYGYPRDARNVEGESVDIAQGYDSFVESVRKARPSEVLSFNQVNGVPRGFEPPASPSFRYVEVWPPNDRWRHLEGLLARSAGRGERHGDTLAIYPPVWDEERTNALRTCVLSEAVTTILGANVLMWGDADGVLSHPYYVNHETLDESERALALEWHQFALRTRDLFRAATDTSWYELSDENASVTVSWDGLTSPEPVGGSLFVRIIRGDDLVVVSLLDLSGNAKGSWSSGTNEGRCEKASVDVLLGSPDSWHNDVAVLGRDHGRYAPIHSSEASMREGGGLHVSVPVDRGWSVLRLTRKVPT
jgi:dextranase